MSTRKSSIIQTEHVVVTSEKTFDQIITALEERLTPVVPMTELLKDSAVQKIPWKEITAMIEKHLGSSGFMIFCKIDHGQLLSLAGNSSKAMQYTIGNPLIAVEMTRYNLAASLYAPFKLAVYEQGTETVLCYDHFSTSMAQFNNEEITRIAEHVDTLLENLIASVV